MTHIYKKTFRGQREDIIKDIEAYLNNELPEYESVEIIIEILVEDK